MTPPRLGALVLAIAAMALAASGAVGQSRVGTGAPNGTVELDRDQDGAVDYRIVYDRVGMVSREEMDYDFNGAMDTFFYYTNGLLQREEIDSNRDGKVDIWVYLVQGNYVQRYERDTDGDGKPDLVRDFGKG